MYSSVLISFTLIHVFNQIVNAAVIPEQPNDDKEFEGPEYYWKDYTGHVPKDAYPGGTNAHGKPTYIGQVLHKGQLIPANIDPEQKKVYYEWGDHEVEAPQNVKILCTEHPEQFEWVATGNKSINNITDKHFVVGGFEEGAKILIGRKQLDDELSVGKIVFTTTESTLTTVKGGKGHQHAEFDVLCYKPDIKSIKKKKDEKTDKACNNLMGLVDIIHDVEAEEKKIIINVH